MRSSGLIGPPRRCRAHWSGSRPDGISLLQRGDDLFPGVLGFLHDEFSHWKNHVARGPVFGGQVIAEEGMLGDEGSEPGSGPEADNELDVRLPNLDLPPSNPSQPKYS